MNPLFDGGRYGSLMGIRVEVVEPGTEITDERTGQKETVRDDSTLLAGNVLYCTKPIADRLAAEFPAKPAAR